MTRVLRSYAKACHSKSQAIADLPTTVSRSGANPEL
jgi:hypothetical protein